MNPEGFFLLQHNSSYIFLILVVVQYLGGVQGSILIE